MKIQFLNGGLANQSFQYIFARYYELSHPGDIMYIDDSYFALNTVHNGYELEKVFGIRPHMLSKCFTCGVWDFILNEKKKGKSVPQILMDNGLQISVLTEDEHSMRSFNPFSGNIYVKPSNLYNPSILDLSGNIYYHGYWINCYWFKKYKEFFLQEFQFPEITDQKNLSYLDQILFSNSLSLHIRRKDYVNLGWALSADVCFSLTEQFRKELSDNWHLFVFSDDIDWCKNHAEEMGFQYFEEVTYIEGNTESESYRDMQLMSMCKAMIVTNSAFCYLAALLNTKKEYYLNPTFREVF